MSLPLSLNLAPLEIEVCLVCPSVCLSVCLSICVFVSLCVLTTKKNRSKTCLKLYLGKIGLIYSTTYNVVDL